ncbi:MAG: type II toxin-antitoxin system VapC family toxin [Spirochaetaceae bacterium]|nr:MAG: type II toxin-antitoxin system VapC family toxin [Spirochaetaceae bacterium]
MRILLDTCTFLWLILDTEDLTERVRDLFVDPDNEVFLSVVSAWEIAVKYAIGRLDLPGEPRLYIPEQRERHRVQSLSLDEQSSLQVSALPKIHNDPFDRMLISQAMMHGLTILSPDELIQKYPVRIIW